VKPLLNSQAVCEVLGITAPTLSRMVHSGKIPHILLTSGKKKLIVRFREEELQSWLDRRSRGALPKAKGETRTDKLGNGSIGKTLEPVHSFQGSKGEFQT
jgi:excisionase family DNA binding protein